MALKILVLSSVVFASILLPCCLVEAKIASSSLYAWSLSGSSTSRENPMPFDVTVGVMQNEFITQVAAGQGHTVALTKKGTIFTWGDNTNGQLGDQSYFDRKQPVAIVLTFMLQSRQFIQIAAGSWHTLALSNYGEVLSWGNNQFGQLGFNEERSSENFPRVVPFDLSSSEVIQISAGEIHSMALTSDGRVFCWGSNMVGQLGHNSTIQLSRTPLQAAISERIVQISAGSWHSAALTANGTVLTWGSNNEGQLGRIDSNAFVPSPINSTGVLTGANITQISAGYSHTVSLTSDGRIISWGSNNCGQLGDNTQHSNNSGPVLVYMEGVPKGTKFVYVAAGFDYTLSITRQGTIYAWGSNNNGQLGCDGPTSIVRLSPVAVSTNGVLSGKSARQVSAGNDHSVAVTTDGKVYSWGNNKFGKLGIGETIASKPVPGDVDTKGVLDGQTITKIASFEGHTIVLTSESKLYGFGRNECGQLGDGTIVAKNFFVAVDMSNVLLGRTISQIAVGRGFSVALDTEGRVYSWGCNHYGQLGIGTRRNSLLPVRVDMNAVTAEMVKSIAVGTFHTVVIDNDDKLYSWGGNGRGQLGDGSTQAAFSPVVVSMPALFQSQIFTQIVAGDSHTVALTSDGVCYAWGSNSDGELGTDSNREEHIPVLTNSINGTVTMIGASQSRTVLLTNDGVIHVWGGNSRYTQHRELVNDKITRLVSGSTGIVAVTNDSRVFAWDTDFYNVNLTNVDPTQYISQAYVTSTGKSGILGVKCVSGYFGQNCESFYCYNITHDSNSVCSGNGNCVSLDTCKCGEGFAGDDCSAPLCFGYPGNSRTVCSSRGKCVAPNECVCPRGYYGETCSINLDFLALLSLLIIPFTALLVVLIIFATYIARRVKKDKKIESDLRACLLEEMTDLENISDMALFIDMKDIKLISRLSEGAAGVVFKGKWKSNLVAVKKMKVPDDESFLKEISILQSLRHPNILYLYGYSSNDAGDKFLITEYATQGSLDKVLYAKDPLRDFNKKMDILCQIADTMSYLHGRSPRIVHRDLKPQNVLIDEAGNVRICDFGLSKTVNTAFTTGVSYGTIEYSAPELLTRNGHDEKCDVYSFGIMMHELFIVEHPYSREQDSLAIFSLGIEIVNSGLRPSIPYTVSTSSSVSGIVNSLDIPDEYIVNEFFTRGNDTQINATSIPALVESYYALVTRCWDTNPARRPPFEDISTILYQIRSSLL